MLILTIIHASHAHHFAQSPIAAGQSRDIYKVYRVIRRASTRHEISSMINYIAQRCYRFRAPSGTDASRGSLHWFYVREWFARATSAQSISDTIISVAAQSNYRCGQLPAIVGAYDYYSIDARQYFSHYEAKFTWHIAARSIYAGRLARAVAAEASSAWEYFMMQLPLALRYFCDDEAGHYCFKHQSSIFYPIDASSGRYRNQSRDEKAWIPWMYFIFRL